MSGTSSFSPSASLSEVDAVQTKAGRRAPAPAGGAADRKGRGWGRPGRAAGRSREALAALCAQRESRCVMRGGCELACEVAFWGCELGVSGELL